jgi:alkanesulfonate monooxygenase SsuD/methylene tetrahydromethanopterin reductase-like flavin-dependent oxidoreductase (luciferase family)
VLSGGRLILGTGLGWLREEFDAVGADFGLRAESFREQLEIMHAAWTRPTASFRGDVFAFEAVGSAPRPSRATGVEVWVGSSARSVLRHACRHATAVHWILEDLREIRRRVDMLDEVAREAGLDEPPQVTLRARIAVDRDPSPATTGVLTGPVAYLVDTLAEYAGAGVTHVLIDRRAGGYDGMQASFDELAPVIGALEGA